MIFAYNGCLHSHAILGYSEINCIPAYGTSGLCPYLLYWSTVLHLLCFTTTLTVPCLFFFTCCIATVSSFALLHHPASAVLHCYCHSVLPAFICAMLSLLDGSGLSYHARCNCPLRYHHHDVFLLSHCIAIAGPSTMGWEGSGTVPPSI